MIGRRKRKPYCFIIISLCALLGVISDLSLVSWTQQRLSSHDHPQLRTVNSYSGAHNISITPSGLEQLELAQIIEMTGGVQVDSPTISLDNSSKLAPTIFEYNDQELPSSNTKSDSYLLFVEINEQLSSNTLKFFQLSYFSALWNLKMVEPWINIHTTYLSTLPSLSSQPGLPFFDLYNKTEVEKMLTKCFNPNLPQQLRTYFKFHTFSETLIHSSREIMIVRFMVKKWSLSKDMGECADISGKEIHYVMKTLNTRVKGVIIEAQEKWDQNVSFTVWKTVCITAIPGVPFSMKNATDYIQTQQVLKQKEKNVDLLVVIISWRKVKNGPVDNYYYYYFDPNFHFKSKHCEYRGLPHASIVLAATDQMLEELGMSGPFVGVYARTEKLGQLDVHSPGYIKECLNTFYKALEVIEARYGLNRSRIILVHDNSKYGSRSLKNPKNAPLLHRSVNILTKLESAGISSTHFAPEQHPGFPQHRAFVAAVEQELLSRSYVLLTLGGGGFMMNVKGRFLQRQKVERLYTLCLS